MLIFFVCKYSLRTNLTYNIYLSIIFYMRIVSKNFLRSTLLNTYSSVLISESSSQVADGRRETLLFSTST